MTIHYDSHEWSALKGRRQLLYIMDLLKSRVGQKIKIDYQYKNSRKTKETIYTTLEDVYPSIFSFKRNLNFGKSYIETFTYSQLLIGEVVVTFEDGTSTRKEIHG